MTNENQTTTENTATDGAAATPAIAIFMGLNAQGELKAFGTQEDLIATLGEGTDIFTTAAELEASSVPLAEIVKGYNQIATTKVRGFKDRKVASSSLFTTLGELAASRAAKADAGTETEKLAAAVKPKKAKKEKKEGDGAGRASPLASKFWARSGTALNGRRIGGTGVGINALQYIITNPGVSTEDYIANSGGGRFVDLQYDLDKGNIVMLKGATPEERTKEIAALTEARKGAEAAEAKKLAEAEAAKKAKAEAAEKAKAEKKAAADKAAADKKAADDKAAAEAKAKTDAEAAAKTAKA